MSLMNFGFTKTKPKENMNSQLESRSTASGLTTKKTPTKTMKTDKSSCSINNNTPPTSNSAKVTPMKSSKKSSGSSPSPKISSKPGPLSSKIAPHGSKSPKTSKTNPQSSKSSKKGDSPKSSKSHSKSSSPSNSPKKSNSVSKSAPKSSKLMNDDSPGKKGTYDLLLPTQRVKMIMKSCPNVETVPQESLQLITKATELFIQQVALDAFKNGGDITRLNYESLSQLVHSRENLEFLKETIPKKITWEECQKRIESNKIRIESYI